MSTTLSTYFPVIGAKRLSEVEVSADASNQHEFNGVREFKKIFGKDKISFAATFILLSDDEDKSISETGNITWYDARANHPTRSEFRLYYTSNEVIKNSHSGDLLIVGKSSQNKLAVIVAPKGSTSEKQLLWLFRLADVRDSFLVKDFTNDSRDIGYAGRYILSEMGINIEEENTDFDDILLDTFGMSFPSTKTFSDFSRSTVSGSAPIDDPDGTLIAWLEREELLFRSLERMIVSERLALGFGHDGRDVEEFIKFSLSVQNRRKARAGFSFEINIALLLTLNGVMYTRGGKTERNNKPDFIFPGVNEYHDQSFNPSLLSMLGVKTSAKDRWRQVLSEAARIPNKHLITLEPAISKNQTDDMIANNIQLIIPQPLLATYQPIQQESIITLMEFISIQRKRQAFK